MSELRVETLESEIVWERGDGEQRPESRGVEHKDQRGRERAEDENCGLRYRVFVQTVRFATFLFFIFYSAKRCVSHLLFFCFLNFGLNRPVRRRYRWLWPIRTDSALIGAYRAEKKKRKGTRHRRAGSGVARRTPRRCFISTAHSEKSRKILDSPYSNKS